MGERKERQIRKAEEAFRRIRRARVHAQFVLKIDGASLNSDSCRLESRFLAFLTSTRAPAVSREHRTEHEMHSQRWSKPSCAHRVELAKMFGRFHIFGQLLLALDDIHGVNGVNAIASRRMNNRYVEHSRNEVALRDFRKADRVFSLLQSGFLQ